MAEKSTPAAVPVEAATDQDPYPMTFIRDGSDTERIAGDVSDEVALRYDGWRPKPTKTTTKTEK